MVDTTDESFIPLDLGTLTDVEVTSTFMSTGTGYSDGVTAADENGWFTHYCDMY